MDPLVDEDFYTILNVPETAVGSEIRRAFKRAALKWHPDKNLGNPESAKRFREVFRAAEILTDKTQRACYDNKRRAALEIKKANERWNLEQERRRKEYEQYEEAQRAAEARAAQRRAEEERESETKEARRRKDAIKEAYEKRKEEVRKEAEKERKNNDFILSMAEKKYGEGNKELHKVVTLYGCVMYFTDYQAEELEKAFLSKRFLIHGRCSVRGRYLTDVADRLHLTVQEVTDWFMYRRREENRKDFPFVMMTEVVTPYSTYIYSDLQAVELEKEFHLSRDIKSNRCVELSLLLCLTEHHIEVWFHKRRQHLFN